jgi:hypothetical protein
VTDAEEEFADRLSADLEETFGIGIVIAEAEISAEPAGVSAAVILLLNGRAESIRASAADYESLRMAIVGYAAERWRTHAFEGLAGPLV